MRTVEAPPFSTKSRYYGRETKFQKVRLELELLANKLGPGQKLPSIRELSVSLGASISTLSGALEEMEKERLLCRHQGKGIFTMPSRSRNISLICDSTFFASGHSPFWDVLVEQVRVRSLVHNEQLSLHFTLPSGESDPTLHHTLVREIEEGRVQGIVGVGLSRKTVHWILDHDVPYTSFAGWAPYSIRLHDEELVRQGVLSLAAKGCRNIAFWQNAWPVFDVHGVEISEWCDLTKYYVRALDECGLTPDPGLVRTNREQTHLPFQSPAVRSAQQQGYRTAMEVFAADRAQWPDGIVLVEDMMTHGVLAAMSGLGVRPGVDVQIATHANRGATHFLGDPPGVTRIEYDPAEVVQQLFNILEALMNREIPSGVQPYAHDTQVRLIDPHSVLAE